MKTVTAAKAELVPMTAKERDALRETIRLRARVAKADVDKRAAALHADTERQLSATFKAESAEWDDLVKMAKKAAEAADAELARRCEALGIRDAFRPTIHMDWYPRGENMIPARRAELRKLAAARIDAMSKEAKHEIESWQADAQTQLLAGVLQTGEAQKFLSDMPKADALLPAPTLAQLDALATTPSLKLVPGKPGTDDAQPPCSNRGESHEHF